MPRRFPPGTGSRYSRNAAAFVLDLDNQAFAFGPGPEDHGAAARRVLKRILQQVHHRRGEELWVAITLQARIDGIHREPDVPIFRVENTGRRNFID